MENSKLSRLDFLKLTGLVLGSAFLAACKPERVETSVWKIASESERRLMAQNLVESWISEIRSQGEPYYQKEIKLSPEVDVNSREEQERLFIDYPYRAAKVLAQQGLIDPSTSLLAQTQSGQNPISLHINPNYLVPEEADISFNKPGKADLIVARPKIIIGNENYEKPDWFGGKAKFITFKTLVEATMKLDDPNETSYNTEVGANPSFAVERKNFWTGKKIHTQWYTWLKEVVSKTKTVEVPDMPVNENALSVLSELQNLFPNIAVPQIQLTEDWRQEAGDFHVNKPGFQIVLKDGNSYYQPPSEAIELDNAEWKNFFSTLRKARELMKKIFKKPYLTTESVRRVMQDEEWTWDRPIEGLPAEFEDRFYTEGLVIRQNPKSPFLGSEDNFYFHTPVRLQPMT